MRSAANDASKKLEANIKCTNYRQQAISKDTMQQATNKNHASNSGQQTGYVKQQSTGTVSSRHAHCTLDVLGAGKWTEVILMTVWK